MMGSRLRCVVFDIDDTLYLEREYVRSGLRAVGDWLSNSRNIGGFPSLASQLFDAGVRGTIFDEALVKLGVEPTIGLIRELVLVYRNHAPDIHLLPEVGECLKRLAERFQLAGLTGGPVQSQQRKVVALRLNTLLSPIVYSGEWGPEFDKPHARAFELIEQLTGFAGTSCAYVADNPNKDFAGPKHLGWRTIRIRREGGLHADLGSGPDIERELPDMSSLADAIRDLNKPSDCLPIPRFDPSGRGGSP